jgi:hypothetical protein
MLERWSSELGKNLAKGNVRRHDWAIKNVTRDLTDHNAGQSQLTARSLGLAKLLK